MHACMEESLTLELPGRFVPKVAVRKLSTPRQRTDDGQPHKHPAALYAHVQGL